MTNQSKNPEHCQNHSELEELWLQEEDCCDDWNGLEKRQEPFFRLGENLLSLARKMERLSSWSLRRHLCSRLETALCRLAYRMMYRDWS